MGFSPFTPCSCSFRISALSLIFARVAHELRYREKFSFPVLGWPSSLPLSPWISKDQKKTARFFLTISYVTRNSIIVSCSVFYTIKVVAFLSKCLHVLPKKYSPDCFSAIPLPVVIHSDQIEANMLCTSVDFEKKIIKWFWTKIELKFKLLSLNG